MINKIMIFLFTIILTSCTLTDKLPKFPMVKECTGDETNKTLAEALCKKK